MCFVLVNKLLLNYRLNSPSFLHFFFPPSLPLPSFLEKKNEDPVIELTSTLKQD